MFNKGKKQAKAILASVIGAEQAKMVLRGVKFCYTTELPFWVDNIPKQGWMGFCCVDNGFYIYINPERHKRADEIALTIGHEFAHVIQMKSKGTMNHYDGIFKELQKTFCKTLGFEVKSF